MQCSCAILSSVSSLSVLHSSTLSLKRQDFTRILAASSMLHEAKIAYYAFDVIRFFVPYRVFARTCCAVNVLTSRISFLVTLVDAVRGQA